MDCVILVDNSNLFIAGQSRSPADRGWRIDFTRLFEFLADGRPVRKAFLFGSALPENAKVWEMARRSGFDVLTHARKPGGKEKAVDTELVVQGALAIATSPPGVLIIASGDRDFIPLVNAAHDRNWTVEMAAFSSAFSPHGEMAATVNKVRKLDSLLLAPDAHAI